MNTKRLKELLVDRCEEGLKEEALALFNEIEEALKDASREAENRRLSEIQRRYKLRDGAHILPEEYDEAIVGSDNGLLVYSSASCVAIDQLEILERIANHETKLHGDMDASESAWAYATEYFEFNVSGDVSEDGPVFLEDR